MDLIEGLPQGAQDNPFVQGGRYWAQAANPEGVPMGLGQAQATPTPMPGAGYQAVPPEVLEAWKREQQLKNLPLIMRGGQPTTGQQGMAPAPYLPHAGGGGGWPAPAIYGSGEMWTWAPGATLSDPRSRILSRLAMEGALSGPGLPFEPGGRQSAEVPEHLANEMDPRAPSAQEARRRKELDEKRQRAGRGPQR
jgi:hypothetical protein